MAVMSGLEGRGGDWKYNTADAGVGPEMEGALAEYGALEGKEPEPTQAEMLFPAFFAIFCASAKSQKLPNTCLPCDRRHGRKESR